MGNTMYVIKQRGNNLGRFIELSEYGGGEWRTFVMIPKGRDSRGWGDCLA